MFANDVADVVRPWPAPARESAAFGSTTLGMLDSGDTPRKIVLLHEQTRPVPEVGEQLVELGVQSVTRGDLLVRLLYVLQPHRRLRSEPGFSAAIGS